MNILFDLDGTLTDPRIGIVACFKHALASLDQPPPDDSDLERFIGPPLREAFEQLLPARPGGVEVDAAIASYRERFKAVGMFENEVYDGIPDVLRRLSDGGARLFVATSKPREFAARILEHFGLAEHFESTYGSELDGRLSHKGELIAHALATERLRAVETIMVGDRRHDILGAIENQVFPAGVLWGFGSEVELTGAGAKSLFGVPSDLVRLVAPDAPVDS